VPTSWAQPLLTGEFDALGVTKVLEAIRLIDKKIKFYQASSSEMFGKVKEVPQTENTLLSAFALWRGQAYGHFITVNYRESYNIFAVSEYFSP
jgi:GDPmannose 4,6-dehydratase